MKVTILSAIVAATVVTGAARADVSVEFNLLTWDNSQASAQLPSAVGTKPAAGQVGSGNDWLVFTGDDVIPGATFNPHGALSHNLAQPPGTSASDFTLAPSLSGMLGLSFTSTGPDAWTVTPTSLAYSGVATPVIAFNQFMVNSGDVVAQNATFNVDGEVTPGTWQAAAASDYAISFDMDYYFATNADGDASPSDVDATFDNATQSGYLIPVDQLNAAGLAAVSLTSPSGFFGGNFEQYLLDEIAPRLPADATFLLVTQLLPTNPVYTGPGLPITTSSTIGNTTIAYTTQAIPEPTSVALLIAGGVGLAMRRRRRFSSNA